ncbi:hypothetical protein D3C81_1714300 [compost metagenome]
MSRAGAVGRHRTAVQFGQLLHDRQPQPQSAVTARGGAIGLAETAEQVLQEFRCDAVTVVVHLHHVVALVLPQLDFDVPIDRRELDRVGQ